MGHELVSGAADHLANNAYQIQNEKPSISYSESPAQTVICCHCCEVFPICEFSLFLTNMDNYLTLKNSLKK